jgi:hypothetical protein
MALIVTGPADVLDTRVVGGIGVAAAIIMLLLKARILYDARVRRTRDGLVLSAPSAEFIEAVRRATDAPHAGKEQVTKPEDIPHSLERKIKLLRVRKRMGRQR